MIFQSSMRLGNQGVTFPMVPPKDGLAQVNDLPTYISGLLGPRK